MFIENWTMDENGIKLRLTEVRKVDLEHLPRCSVCDPAQ
jgi:hypothetical protein